MQSHGNSSRTVLSNTLYVDKIDEVYVQIITEDSIAQELCDYFTFAVPGHEFMPSFQKKIWDGKIRLFSIQNRKLYYGLVPYLLTFSEKYNYGIELACSIDRIVKFDDEKGDEFIQSLQLPLEVRDYQLEGIRHALVRRRCLLVSPTASGKSLIIYLFIRFIIKEIEGNILIVVPTTSLVEQLYKDFVDYGFESEKFIHRIYSGREKNTDKRITISTWQSLFKEKKQFFETYSAVIGDEAHLFKAKSLTSIMTKLVNAKYRIGTTGTLDGTQTHQLVLEGLFGKVKQITTTKQLIDSDILAFLEIHCIVLRHPISYSEDVLRFDYYRELDYLVSCNERNQFITDMTSSLNGNTLVLFQLVEKHGEVLYTMMKDQLDKNVVFIHGGVETDVREVIRETAEKINDLVIVASYGTYSTGINIKNLHNIVFASPSKSPIRVLQSIGRGLRKGVDKNEVKLFDISDDLSIGSHSNYTYRHLLERLKIYNDEDFTYKIKKFNLEYL